MLNFFNHVQLFMALWTVLDRLLCLWDSLEYWSGLPCLLQGNLPNPGLKPVSLVSPALAGGLFTISANWEANLSEVFQNQHIQNLKHEGIPTHNCLPMFHMSVNSTVSHINWQSFPSSHISSNTMFDLHDIV